MKSIVIAPLVFVSAAVIAQNCDLPMEQDAPNARFQLDPSDRSIVLDLRTGLSWQRCSVGNELDDANTDFFEDDSCALIDQNPQDGVADLEDLDTDNDVALTYSWLEALEFAELEGNGWRVPNIKELASLVEYACSQPAINSQVFPGTAQAQYWSSTPATFDDSSAWTVNFSLGSDDTSDKNLSHFLLLVRD